MKPEDLLTEARARIIWGDPPESVRAFLTAMGLPAAEAEAAIKRFTEERYADIRRQGRKKTGLGAALSIGAGTFFYLAQNHLEIDKLSVRGARGLVMAALLIGIAGFYGLWQLLDGITNLFRPQAEEKSISEISE